MHFEASNTEVEEKRSFQERKLKVVSSEIDQEELLSCVTNEVDLGDQKDQIITVLKKKKKSLPLFVPAYVVWKFF